MYGGGTCVPRAVHVVNSGSGHADHGVAGHFGERLQGALAQVHGPLDLVVHRVDEGVVVRMVLGEAIAEVLHGDHEGRSVEHPVLLEAGIVLEAFVQVAEAIGNDLGLGVAPEGFDRAHGPDGPATETGGSGDDAGTAAAERLGPLADRREPAAVEEKHGDEQERHSRPDARADQGDQCDDERVAHYDTDDPSENGDHAGDRDNAPDLAPPHKEGVGEDDPLDEGEVPVELDVPREVVRHEQDLGGQHFGEVDEKHDDVHQGLTNSVDRVDLLFEFFPHVSLPFVFLSPQACFQVHNNEFDRRSREQNYSLGDRPLIAVLAIFKRALLQR